MEEKKFLDEVLGHIPRLTAGERQSLRRELSDHMADHVEMLERRGLNKEEAQEQAVNAMGDPEEVGRELAKAYSPFWYWVLQAANFLLTLVVLFAMVWGITEPLVRAWNNLELRNSPDGQGKFWGPDFAYRAVDIRISMVTDEMRIYSVELDRKNAMAYVMACVYDKNPFGHASRLQYDAVTVTNQAGQAREGSRAVSMTEPWEWEPGRLFYDVPVSPGDTCVYFTYDRFGTHVEYTLPLPEWEGEE